MVTKAIKETKYKVGEFLAGPEIIFFRIAIVMPQDDGNTIYGVKTCKSTALQWHTQFEIDNDNMTLQEPKFDKFTKARAGDMVMIKGGTQKTKYFTILARIGDACLLSSGSDAQSKMLLDLDEFFAEVSGREEGLLDEKEKQRLRQANTPTMTHKAAGDWVTVETMALMNWDLIDQEE